MCIQIKKEKRKIHLAIENRKSDGFTEVMREKKISERLIEAARESEIIFMSKKGVMYKRSIINKETLEHEKKYFRERLKKIERKRGK